MHKVFFHKKKFQKYCSKVSPVTEIQKLSLFSISEKTFFNVSFLIGLKTILLLP